MSRPVLIIPIFWGTSWRPGKGPIEWPDVYADISTVAASYYLAGLSGYGLAAQANVQSPVIVDAPDSAIPNPFTEDQVWTFLDGLIDSGTVPAPDNWDPAQFRVHYGIAIAPNHANQDPNTFGQNNKTYRTTACAAYSTANSNRAGVLTTYWHEVVEAAANDEIVDDCRADTFEVGGIRVSRYCINSRCWPYAGVDVTQAAAALPRTEGPFSADVPVLDGLCGTQSISYHVVYDAVRVTATADAPGLDGLSRQWFLNKRVVAASPSTMTIPVNQIDDPRPPKHSAGGDVTVHIEEAGDRLVFTTEPNDGNYDLDVTVEIQSGAVARATSGASIVGIHCPEIDEADRECRNWFERNTDKLDRDWRHWIDPSDPLIEIIRRRPEWEQDRLLLASAGSRELEALGRGEAEELAGRVGAILEIDPGAVLGH